MAGPARPSTFEAVVATGVGAAKAAATGYAASLGTGYAAGLVCAAAPGCAEVVVVGVGTFAAGATAYQLYNGGFANLMASGRRLVNHEGTLEDYETVGGLGAGLLSPWTGATQLLKSGIGSGIGTRAFLARMPVVVPVGIGPGFAVIPRGPAGPSLSTDGLRGVAERIAAEGEVSSWQRTVGLLETVEGDVLVAGGATDLSPAQKALAEALGLRVVPDLPGIHAEGTLLNGAGELGLTPRFGYVTNNVCGSTCAPMIREMGVGSKESSLGLVSHDAEY